MKDVWLGFAISLLLIACGEEAASEPASGGAGGMGGASPNTGGMAAGGMGGADGTGAGGANTGGSGGMSSGVDGTHTIMIDFAQSLTPRPPEWNVVHLSAPMTTGLVDAVSNATTNVMVAWASYSGTHFAALNWPADVDWIPTMVGQEAFTQGLAETTPASVTFTGLDGDYRIEVVAVEGIQSFNQRTTVNGATTTTTYDGTQADSGSWDPQIDGTQQTNWLIWPRVAPIGGTITIEQLPGWINAVRFTPPTN